MSALRAAALLALALGGAARGEERVDLDERRPLPVVVLSAPGLPPALGRAALVDALASVLRERSRLTILADDEAAVASCRGALSCLALQARARHPGERAVLVVSWLPAGEGRARLLALLLDVEEAIRIHQRADRADPDWPALAEAAVGEGAVLFRGGWAPARNGEELRGHLRALVEPGLASALSASGSWPEAGEIRLGELPEGAVVAVDGRVAARRGGGALSLVGVLAGRRVLSVEAPGHAPWSGAVEVLPGQAAEVRPALVPLGPDYTRGGLLVGGLTVAAAGAGIVAWAALRGGPQVVCLEIEQAGPCEDRLRFAQSDLNPGRGRFGEDPNRGGPLLGPLGASLLTAGTVWALGAWLDTEDREWWTMLLGAASGVAVYGLAALLQPASAFAP